MENKEDITNIAERISIQKSVLSISASMLGFCFVIISYLQVTKLKSTTYIDDVIMFALVAFLLNCLIAFLALRNRRFQTKFYVNLTSSIYMIGMLILFGIALLMAFGSVN